jgi:uncharacterized damage-inducible protein DinB
MIEETFLKFSSDKLEQLGQRIEDCLGRLNADQIWLRNTENENSVGNLVLHLCGNVRQWIGFGVAGKPDIRVRDAEFAARGGVQLAELSQRLKTTLAEGIETIRSLPPARLLENTSVQNYEGTVMQAIFHVVEHFAQHTAQIIFATKLLTGQDLGYYKHLSKPKHFETTP